MPHLSQLESTCKMEHGRVSLEAPPIIPSFDDERENALLARICAAYKLAVEKAPQQEDDFDPTGWWQDIKTKHLEPVQKALLSADIPALRCMYRNFFHDPCGLGLVHRPPTYTTSGMLLQLDEEDYRIVREDTLRRIQFWRAITQGRFPLAVLEGPPVGNPFGATIEGVFIAVASEYQHACADRIHSLTGPGATIVEIGGGYGHMAYYLLRDEPAIKYYDFDMPESLALAAYYLGCSFPERSLLLYGEDPNLGNGIGKSDIILMPPWEMQELGARKAQLAFSSHVLSDLAPHAREAYLQQIARFTDGFVVDIAGERSPKEEDEAFEASFSRSFELAEKRKLEWNAYRAPETIEWERVYRTVGSSAATH